MTKMHQFVVSAVKTGSGAVEWDTVNEQNGAQGVLTWEQTRQAANCTVETQERLAPSTTRNVSLHFPASFSVSITELRRRTYHYLFV